MSIGVAIWLGSVGFIFGYVASVFADPDREKYVPPKGYWDPKGDLGQGRFGSKWVEEK